MADKIGNIGFGVAFFTLIAQIIRLILEM